MLATHTYAHARTHTDMHSHTRTHTRTHTMHTHTHHVRRVMNLREESLAFILADQGYDV